MIESHHYQLKTSKENSKKSAKNKHCLFPEFSSCNLQLKELILFQRKYEKLARGHAELQVL
jgi:hypothetical protein